MTSYKNSDPRPPIMRGTPPDQNQRVTLENWDSPPYNRWSFQRIREVLPTANVHRGRGPRAGLPEAPIELGHVHFDTFAGGRSTLDTFLDDNFTDGFIVLHRGRVVFERYFNGMRAESLHLSQSVAKSFVGATAGVLFAKGMMDPDRPISDYLPELESSGYGAASIRNVMDMQSGVAFNEEYTDPDSDVAYIDRLAGWKPRRPGDPADMLELMQRLKQEWPHGQKFLYRSIETDVLAMAMERATGMRLADIVSRELWDPLGPEEDACFTVDPAGYALADGGFNATLRDYARFGQMLTQSGHFNGRQILPAEWVEECRSGDPALFGENYRAIMTNGAYRNTFWNEDADTRVLMCIGVFGQCIYSNPDRNLTIVKLSTWPEFVSDERKADMLRSFHAIAAWLKEND